MQNLITDIAASTLSLKRVAQSAELVTLNSEWDMLLARLSRATCFQRLDWLTTWWHIFVDADNNKSGAQLWVLLLYEQGGTLVGVLPMYCQHYRCGPLRLRVLRWLGQGHGALTDTLGPLFVPGYEQVGMCCGLAYLAEQRGQWDVLALAHTPADLSATIRAYAHEQGWHPITRAVMGWLAIRLPSDWTTYQRALSKNLRSNLPRYRNRLLREERMAHVEILTSPEAILAALPQLFLLHRQRAHAMNMKRHSDYFASATSRAFMLLIAMILSWQRRVALARMIVDGQVVAMQLLLFEGDGMSLYFSGFDPAWGRYSVMMLTTKASLQYAMAQGITWVDLTAGAGSQAKRQWANEEYYKYYVLVTHNLFWNYCVRWGMRLLNLCSAIQSRMSALKGRLRWQQLELAKEE